MIRSKISVLALALCSVAVISCSSDSGNDAMKAAGSAAASAAMPFSGPDSVAYAATLWGSLQGANLVGRNAVVSKPYKGQHPHGAVLDTIESKLTINGHSGTVVVKNNYGGPDATTASVANDPAKHLEAVTVMYRREAGYDAENKDWFWAKYLPDGSLDKNKAGMQLAGRVAKGKPAGCIACHTAAPGGDMVFNHDRYAK